MKRRIIILCIGIFIFIGIMGLSHNSNNKKTFTQNGITYALTLDGASTSSFPSKGMYRADVTCEGATGKWLYDEWELAIEDIISNNVACDIDFTTISQTNLNNYIISLSGSKQGTGEVVDEGNITLGDYSSATPLTESQYGTPTTYSSSTYYSTSGTTTSGTFTFSNNNWTSVPSTMTSGTYYHIQVTPQTEGYYQICYEVGSGNSSNRLYAYVNNTYQNLGGGSVSASTNSSKSGCQSLGYLSTSDTVRVVQQAYSSTSYGISTTSFRLERCSSLESHIGYRYEGKDPNNYIWFNNELWRIIGVFDSTSHGVSGQNLVKIIRNDSIGALAWHKSNTNDWTASNLMNLLNGAYLNSQNGTGGEYCYGYGYFSISSNCNYTETGINDAYRTMIENATWYLGGHSTHDATAESFYEYERGPSVYGERPTTWEGLIGLMYPSDYGYSVLASSCPRTRYLGSYNSPSCAGQSWIYGQGYEWTITPQSTSSDNVFDVGVDGPLSYYGNTYEGQNARPVLYLDPNVYVIDGDGSITDPYIIGM